MSFNCTLKCTASIDQFAFQFIFIARPIYETTKVLPDITNYYTNAMPGKRDFSTNLKKNYKN